MKNLKKKEILICLIFSSGIFAKEDIKLSTGNLALPTSQQPGALFSFGQNIVDKGDILSYFFASYLKGPSSNYSQFISGVVYGFSDSLSMFVVAPIATKFEKSNSCSSGLQDIAVQFEYAYYNTINANQTTQATIVANMSIPTGSAQKSPNTGLGSPGFFIGTTISHIAPDWYFYASSAFVLALKNSNNKFGNQFLYQFGLGRNIGNPKGSILTWMFEFNGVWAQKDVCNNRVDHFSGGNILYGGPTVWFSTERLTLQAGVQFPIVQEFNDVQDNVNYYIGFLVGWKFN